MVYIYDIEDGIYTILNIIFMWCSLLRAEDGIRNIYVVLTVTRVRMVYIQY